MNPAERPVDPSGPAAPATEASTAMSAASARGPMAHRVPGPRGRGGDAVPAELLRRALPTGRRGWLTAAGIAAICLVALVGALNPAAAAHGASPFAPTPAPAASSSTSIADAWGSAGGIDLVDLTWKGALVLVLLFVTLRVMGRMQSGGRATRTGHLAVLESRTLASKASLHLVAVGERRIVVGLTPSGMVALAELGSDELPEPELEPGAAGTVAMSGAGATTQPLASVVAPVDAFADRLAALFVKARAR